MNEKLNLTSIPLWDLKDNFIEREFLFKNFMNAMSFMMLVAEKAETMDHHPDWNNVYNKVQIKLSTHSKGCVTEKDIELAINIDSIFSNYQR